MRWSHCCCAILSLVASRLHKSLKYYTLLHKRLKYFNPVAIHLYTGCPNRWTNFTITAPPSAEVKAATSACFPHWAATAVCSCIRCLRSCVFLASLLRLRIFLAPANLSCVFRHALLFPYSRDHPDRELSLDHLDRELYPHCMENPPDQTAMLVQWSTGKPLKSAVSQFSLKSFRKGITQVEKCLLRTQF